MKPSENPKSAPTPELEIMAAKITRATKEMATEHYQHLKDKPFFDELIKYLQGELHNRRKVMALVYWGEDAIKKCRELAGATNPEEADPTSIRGSYGRITTAGVYENVIHVSSNPAEAEREIKLWFEPEEIIVDLYRVKEITGKEKKAKAWA